MTESWQPAKPPLPPDLRYQSWWRNAYWARLSDEEIAWLCGWDV